MNAEDPPGQESAEFPLEAGDDGIYVQRCTLNELKTQLDFTLSGTGTTAPREITVLFPGVAKTVFIRDVRSAFVGELINFTRPAPRVVAITVPRSNLEAAQSVQFRLDVSSPALTKAFVTSRPWPCAELCRLDGPQFNPEEFQPWAGTDSDKRKAREFFLEYDAATNPFLFPDNPTIGEFDQAVRSALMEKAVGVLIQRTQVRGRVAITARAGLGRTDPIPAPADLESIRYVSEQSGIDQPMTRNEVRFLSTLQKNIITRHFARPSSIQQRAYPFDFEAVAEAFYQFANGELRVDRPAAKDARIRHRISKWNCEPDSAKLFLFAEFALLALESLTGSSDAAAREFWEQMLPIFTEIQPIYTERYAPKDSSKPKFEHYREGNFQAPKASAYQGPKARSEGPQNSRDLAERIGANLVQAFPGDFEPPANTIAMTA